MSEPLRCIRCHGSAEELFDGLCAFCGEPEPEPCPACHGTGEVRAGATDRECRACGGNGIDRAHSFAEEQ